MDIPTTLISFLWAFIKKQRIAFFFLFATSFVWAINTTFFPYLIKVIINKLESYHGVLLNTINVIKVPLIIMACLWLIMEISLRLQGLVYVYTFPKFRANIRQFAFDYVRQHSHQYFANQYAGKIASKIADLPVSSERIMEIVLFNFVSILLAFIITSILFWRASPIFAVILMTWAALHLGISFFFLRSAHSLAQIHSEMISNLSGNIVDSLTNITNISLFARGRYESEYLLHLQREEISKAKKVLWHLEKMRIMQGLAVILFMGFTLAALIYGYSAGWASLGDFALVSMSSFEMIGYIWSISFLLTVYIREAGKISAALGLISLEHEIKDKPNAKELKVDQGEVRFEKVTFGYHNKNELFKELSTTIKGGQKVGLVGFSGSGKTTFVNLILRFYDVKSGRIVIDQQSIADVTLNSLRSQIAMIPQEPTLFHRTIMENIRYGKIDATDEEVIAAAKLAHCHEFISQLAQGYHTLVGERGAKLSGGQRQRIAIARATLKGAPLLILDEATSALDSLTEKYIQESLLHLMQHSTTFVIAHRLSTLDAMDRILVFEKGQIIEDGSIDELLADSGSHFSLLWKMQSKGFLPDQMPDTAWDSSY